MGANFMAVACFNAATDILLLLLPVWMIKELTLPLRRKLSVALLLMAGSL